MTLPRIYRKMSGIMIARLNNSFVFSPVFSENFSSMQKPPSILIKVQCFCSARTAHVPKVWHSVSARLSSTLAVSSVSRAARTVAQDVFFDYLHSTRSLTFTDAEYISKNSPHFLNNLLSKIDSDKDVVRGLSKFLRYNPINEFEPFFESLGLSPSELCSLLPRHFMFLSDDDLLLENFHILCNYGIPRSKIGRMYKEAREIFGYGYGLLAFKLHAYEKLGLSKTMVIKLVSCCPSLLIGDVNKDFVKVLERFKILGIKNDLIGGFLSSKDSYNWKRLLETMDFLDKVGYSEEQLCNLFKTDPALVFQGSGKKVYIVFGRLLKLGIKMNENCSLVIQNPQILLPKCEKKLLHAVDFLFNIGMEAENIAKIVYKHVELMCSCSLKGPKTVCRELKVNKDTLCQIIREEPIKLFKLACKSELKNTNQAAYQHPCKQLEKTAFLLRLGYVENSEEMMRALKRFRGRGDQLQERFDCLVEAGLDYNVVSNLIKQAPMVLNQSKDVIEKKIDCLINLLGYPIESVVAFPAYLCYDTERINLRFRMYAWLRDRGAAKSTLSLSTILACSDARFVKYFVEIHPEGPVFWESLRNVLAST